MHGRFFGAAVVAALVVCWTAGTLSAQQRQPPSAQPSIMNDEDETPATAPQQPAKPARARSQNAAPAFEQDPDLDARDQLAPSQVTQPMPGAVAEPSHASGRKTARAPAAAGEAMAEPAAPAKPPRLAAPQVVACNGVFGKDSSHRKLAMAFQAKNVAYTQVDADAGNKAMASVVFANEPKRRLEVWWSKPARRSDTHLIVINGESSWTAPNGLRLGLTLAELETLNGKPFKLLGFDKNNVAALAGWDGGALATIAGGCRIGVRLRADPDTSALALGIVSGNQEVSSTNIALRATNPTVSEILIAY